MISSVIVAGTFVTISLAILLVGRLLMSHNKDQPNDRQGNRRALVLGRLTEAFAGVFPIAAVAKEKIKKDMSRAGFYNRKAAEEFLAMRNASMIAWVAFVGLAIVAVGDENPTWTPKLAVAGAIVLALIYGVPRLVLGSLASARTQRIQHALPDVLDLINMMVIGGLPVQRAIKRVSREVVSPHPDIACELAIIDRQAEAGTLEQALTQFAERIDVPDVFALANLVRHAERLGGNVTTALGDFADSIRRTRRQRAEERGNKSSVKLLFPVVFCLAPPIYILLLGPAALELREFVNRENRSGGVLSQDVGAASTQSISRTPAASDGGNVR